MLAFTAQKPTKSGAWPARWLLAIAMIGALALSACAATPPAELIVHPEADLTAEARNRGFDPAEPLVQIFRGDSGLVFSDFTTTGESSMFGLPPHRIEQRANRLADETFEEADGWLAVGFDPESDAGLVVRYRNTFVLLQGDNIYTSHILWESGPSGTTQGKLDSLPLKPGQAAYLDSEGKLVQMDRLEMEEVRQARTEELPYRVVPRSNPLVRLATARGDLTIELLEDYSPNAVAAFLELVASGYWEQGCTFYRVCPYSVSNGGENLRIAQLGNPDQRLGWSLPLESNAIPHVRGTVAMVVEEGAMIPGHLFFNLAESTITGWQDKYPVFAVVVETGGDQELPALDVLDSLRPGDALLGAHVIRQRRRQYQARRNMSEEDR